MTMTLWPHQEQADEKMWSAYRRRTARPGAVEQEAAKQQPAEQQPAEQPPQRRGRVSENPQPEKDA